MRNYLVVSGRVIVIVSHQPMGRCLWPMTLLHTLDMGVVQRCSFIAKMANSFTIFDRIGDFLVFFTGVKKYFELCRLLCYEAQFSPASVSMTDPWRLVCGRLGAAGQLSSAVSLS